MTCAASVGPIHRLKHSIRGKLAASRRPPTPAPPPPALQLPLLTKSSLFQAQHGGGGVKAVHPRGAPSAARRGMAQAFPLEASAALSSGHGAQTSGIEVRQGARRRRRFAAQHESPARQGDAPRNSTFKTWNASLARRPAGQACPGRLPQGGAKRSSAGDGVSLPPGGKRSAQLRSQRTGVRE